jgi:hypothetical protein
MGQVHTRCGVMLVFISMQSNTENESVSYKTIRVHFLRALSCCYHGNHKGQLHGVPQESTLI